MANKKLNTVMLIDDNDVDNLIHQMVIEDAEITKSITVMNEADKALEYLRENNNMDLDLIFLDINMPRMDGFEFLEEYHALNLANNRATIIIMLSTSCSSHDKATADKFKVNGFLEKPLTNESLLEVIAKYF